MSYTHNQAPQTVNEWRIQNPDALFFRYNKKHQTLFAHHPTNKICPWCDSPIVIVEKYSFIDHDYDYVFPSCSNYRKCDWKYFLEPAIELVQPLQKQ